MKTSAKTVAGCLFFLGAMLLCEVLWHLLAWDEVYFLLMACVSIALGAAVAFSGFLFDKESLAGQTPKTTFDKTSFQTQHTGIAPEEFNRICAKSGLTMREREVCSLLARGYPIKMVSTTLAISPNTVKTQVKSIYAKLGLHSRDDLIALFDAPSSNVD